MDEKMVLVKQGEPLPKRGTRWPVVSALTGDRFLFKIKAITEVEWAGNGDVVVTVQGERVKGEE
jgi:hypothetical protein